MSACFSAQCKQKLTNAALHCNQSKNSLILSAHQTSKQLKHNNEPKHTQSIITWSVTEDHKSQSVKLVQNWMHNWQDHYQYWNCPFCVLLVIEQQGNVSGTEGYAVNACSYKDDCLSRWLADRKRIGQHQSSNLRAFATRNIRYGFKKDFYIELVAVKLNNGTHSAIRLARSLSHRHATPS